MYTEISCTPKTTFNTTKSGGKLNAREGSALLQLQHVNIIQISI